MPKQDRADIGAAQGQSKVSALARDDSVDGETAGAGGSFGEEILVQGSHVGGHNVPRRGHEMEPFFGPRISQSLEMS